MPTAATRGIKASMQPKRTAPPSARQGFHRAKMTRAIAIHPRPPVSPSTQILETTTVR